MTHSLRHARRLVLPFLLSVSVSALPAAADIYPQGEPAPPQAADQGRPGAEIDPYNFTTPSQGKAALERFLDHEPYRAETDADISISYGQALLDAHQPELARKVLKRAYKRLRRRGDSAQVHTAEVLIAQATIDYHLGWLSSRRRALKKAYKSYADALGGSAETTLATRLDYAEALLQEGYYELSFVGGHHGFHGHHFNVYGFGRSEVRQVAKASRAALGPLAPTTLRAEIIFASSSLKTGYYNSAEEALNRLISTTRLGAEGLEGESALTARQHLIHLLVACDRAEEAVSIRAELEAFAARQPARPQEGDGVAPAPQPAPPPSMYPDGVAGAAAAI